MQTQKIDSVTIDLLTQIYQGLYTQVVNCCPRVTGDAPPPMLDREILRRRIIAQLATGESFVVLELDTDLTAWVRRQERARKLRRLLPRVASIALASIGVSGVFWLFCNSFPPPLWDLLGRVLTCLLVITGVHLVTWRWIHK